LKSREKLFSFGCLAGSDGRAAFTPVRLFSLAYDPAPVDDITPPITMAHGETVAQDNDRSMTHIFAKRAKSSESYCLITGRRENVGL
jgi:hypothetical protein